MKRNIFFLIVAIQLASNPMFGQQPENAVNPFIFSCAPTITSLTVTEAENENNTVTTPSGETLIICEKEEGLAQIVVTITADNLVDSGIALWEMSNEFGEIFDGGEFNNELEIDVEIFTDEDNVIFIKTGIDSNGDEQLNDTEVVFTTQVMVLIVRILANAEMRSFNPASDDDSGIVEIILDVRPSLSTTGGHLEWSQDNPTNDTPDLWDDYTGAIEFQSGNTASVWLPAINFGLLTEKNIRVAKAGKTNLVVKYVVGDMECETRKELSAPQFIDLKYSVTYTDEIYDIDGDLSLIGLRNENIGTGANQITEERNQIIKNQITDFAKIRMDEIYQDLNVRFTENTPDFLEDKMVLTDIAGNNLQLNAYGITANVLDLQCNDINSTPLSAFVLDIGNQISIGKLCVFVTKYTIAGGFEDDWTTIFEDFNSDDGTPVSNTYFDNNNEIIDDDLKIAIEKFGRLVGFTTAHEAGHVVGLVPDSSASPHNDGDGGFVMDDGGVTDFGERTDNAMFKVENKTFLLNILPAGEQPGFFE